MRIVLDTNILIGALITNGTPPDRLCRAWLQPSTMAILLLTAAAHRRDEAVMPGGCHGVPGR